MAIFSSAACRLPTCLWSKPCLLRIKTSQSGHSFFSIFLYITPTFYFFFHDTPSLPPSPMLHCHEPCCDRPAFVYYRVLHLLLPSKTPPNQFPQNHNDPVPHSISTWDQES